MGDETEEIAAADASLNQRDGGTLGVNLQNDQEVRNVAEGCDGCEMH